MTDPGSINERDFVQSIERGFAVLMAFDEEHPRMSMAEVAQQTGLSRPATRRILLTLQALGYVAGSDGSWFLTPRVLVLAQRYSASHSLVELAQPLLLRLAEETQESASLAALVGTEVVYIARVQVRRILSMNIDVGSRMPTTATSTGRVLMAWRDPDFVERVIAEQGMPRFTEYTVTDPVRLSDILQQVRQQGFCSVESELELGLLSASVPVRDGSGEVVSAIAYSTSLGRLTREHVESEVIPRMLDVSDELSRLLAYDSTDKRPPSGP
ncbi:IclR family transcriptional regulator C-terminal domain-containing protein [Streptomyces sp. NPDC005820]|uniref:IclR family transcriptional regulator domain-containing protein n=1 Tax=Streptomyces sp. NPDC005820 TaxID=3157069 RepID=UPI0033E2A96D